MIAADSVDSPHPRRLILASASPRRREILDHLGVPFEVRAPRSVDESAARGAAVDVARTLAALKAEEVRADLGREGSAEAWILAADTVVAVGQGPDELLLGKPLDLQDAGRMLRLLSGRVHVVWTGVAVAQPGRPLRVEAERSEVTFRPLSEEAVERYVGTGEPLGKAGAYAIQERGAMLVESFSGCYYNIVGLPLVLAASLLDGAVKAPECDCALRPGQRGREGCSRKFG